MIWQIVLGIVLAFVAFIILRKYYRIIKGWITRKLIIYRMFLWGALDNKHGTLGNEEWEYHFDNSFQKYLHIIPGNILFYGILIYSLIFLFFYHPYADGFYVKDNTYQVGDTIIVADDDKEKLMATVSEVHEDGKYIILIDGKSGIANEDKWEGDYIPKGRYIPSDDNFFIQLNKCAYLYVKNLFE